MPSLVQVFGYGEAMERLVKHLWNRSWGTMNRRDLWLFEVDDGWLVRMREGHLPIAEGAFAAETEAREMFDSIRDDSGITWKDITGVHAPRQDDPSEQADPEHADQV